MFDKRDVLEAEEYRAFAEGNESVALLVDDYREVRVSEPLSGRHKHLAELALSIHQHARHLSAAELEQAVRWLKAWKVSRQALRRPNDRGQTKMYWALKELRESSEQVRLQNRAWRDSAISRFGAFLLCGLVLLALILHEDTWRWYHYASVVLLLLGLFGWTEQTSYRAIETAKEQDRRYFLASLREAQTVGELNEAGLFAYTGFEPSSNFDVDEWKAVMRKECERFSDALYCDPDELLEPISTAGS
jgi:uncharacterized membrane protein YqjE